MSFSLPNWIASFFSSFFWLVLPSFDNFSIECRVLLFDDVSRFSSEVSRRFSYPIVLITRLASVLVCEPSTGGKLDQTERAHH